MAFQTQRADVFEVAFAAAFHHGKDVIGVPQAFARTGPQSPFQKSFQPSGASQTL